MKKTLLLSTCLMAVSIVPAMARDGFGAAFGGAALGGAVGSILGNSLSQPAPVYAPPPVYMERRVYVAPPPVYVAPRAPAQRVVFHPYPGPGFACYEPEGSSVNRAICGSQDLSALSLSVIQAENAVVQQAPYNGGQVKAEYNSSMQQLRANCGTADYQQIDCITGSLNRQRDSFTGRLTGIFAEEGNRPIGLHVELQQRLKNMGLLAGTADGVYGDGTRRAIANWQSRNGKPATGVIRNDEVAILAPGFQAPTIPATYSPPPPVAAPPAPPPTVQASAPPSPPPAIVSAPVPTPVVVADPLGGLHDGMPYALARPKLMAAGWQTGFFNANGLSENDKEQRAWFVDHRVTEVEDCSSSGCKMQFHNADGKVLYVYTQNGSHTSDAFRGAGPSVIAFCEGADDIACTSRSSQAPQQAAR